MKFEKRSTFIFGLISTVGVLLTAYIAFPNPTPKLNAYISESIFYIPPQYKNLVNDTIKNADWSNLYSLIDPLTKEASVDQKDKVIKTIRKIILTPLAAPFKKGLRSYKTLIYISVNNNGSAVAKNVYVDFPEEALLMVEDDKSDNLSSKGLIKRYKIASIRQNGSYRIWAWVKSESRNFNRYKIRVGNENQVAAITYSQSYSGMAARIADNYKLIMLMLAAMLCTFLYVLYSVFRDESKPDT